MPPSSVGSLTGNKLAESKKDLPPSRSPEGAREPESRSTQRVLVLLTALPLGLAAFAFLISGPPFEENDAMPGWADRQGAGRPPGNESVDAAGSHCPSRPKNTQLMFPYRPWHASLKPLDAPRICICTTTAAGLDQTLPWLFYHRTLGVELFLIFAEGKAALPENAAALESIPGVTVIQRTKELDYRQAHSRVWNETWLSFFFYKPCNYELFVRQSLNMEVAIDRARAAKMDWISHVDTDELLYPAGAAEFSLQRLLADAPPDADTVIFPNYETAIERDDISDPFSEISMFKKNFDHVSKEAYFGHYKEATKGNPNYYLTYGNGKSAARMVDHLRSNGAHRFHNYARIPKEHKFPEAAVLHYTYTKFSDLTSRRDRCGCKPTKEDVKRCFMLDFDRMAFIVASTQTEEQMREWYREHVVWTDPSLNDKLLKKGLFGRIHTPQVIVRGIQSSGIINTTIQNGLDLLKRRAMESKGGGGKVTSSSSSSSFTSASSSSSLSSSTSSAGAFSGFRRRRAERERSTQGVSGSGAGSTRRDELRMVTSASGEGGSGEGGTGGAGLRGTRGTLAGGRQRNAATSTGNQEVQRNSVSDGSASGAGGGRESQGAGVGDDSGRQGGGGESVAAGAHRGAGDDSDDVAVVKEEAEEMGGGVVRGGSDSAGGGGVTGRRLLSMGEEEYREQARADDGVAVPPLPGPTEL